MARNSSTAMGFVAGCLNYEEKRARVVCEDGALNRMKMETEAKSSHEILMLHLRQFTVFTNLSYLIEYSITLHISPTKLLRGRVRAGGGGGASVSALRGGGAGALEGDEVAADVEAGATLEETCSMVMVGPAVGMGCETVPLFIVSATDMSEVAAALLLMELRG